MRYLTFSEYQRLERPGVQWLVHGLIAKPGRVLLVGLPKVGKSNLALQIALAVAGGNNILGSKVEKGKVLFLQLDAPEFEWKVRFDSLVEAGIELPDNAMLVHPDDLLLPFNIQTPDAQKWLTTVVNDVNPDMIVLDVLRELHTGDENSSQEMKVACTPLFHILRRQSLLLLHHTTKLNEGQDYDPIKVARGSGYIGGAVTSVALLHNNTLKVVSRLAAPAEFRGHKDDIGLWHFEEDTKEKHILGERLIEVVQAHPGIPLHQVFKRYVEPVYKISRSTFFRKVGYTRQV